MREAVDLVDADGKRSYRKTRHAEERAKAVTGDHKGCLGTERSEVHVAKSGIPLRASERRAGVRASIGAGKRVTSVEQREAGRWMWCCQVTTKPFSPVLAAS